MKKGRFALFIKTTKKNYVMNIVVSLFIGFILTTLSSKLFFAPYLLIYAALSFRIMEYFLTKKAIEFVFPIIGPIRERKEAQDDVLLYSITLIVLFIIFFLHQ